VKIRFQQQTKFFKINHPSSTTTGKTEYVVTVVNGIPEQESLSLCCLLQQPITLELKQTILSFFVKLLSFDQQYKKVLREVGVLEVMYLTGLFTHFIKFSNFKLCLCILAYINKTAIS
jgi:hypothetical protein